MFKPETGKREEENGCAQDLPQYLSIHKCSLELAQRGLMGPRHGFGKINQENDIQISYFFPSCVMTTIIMNLKNNNNNEFFSKKY